MELSAWGVLSAKMNPGPLVYCVVDGRERCLCPPGSCGVKLIDKALKLCVCIDKNDQKTSSTQ